MTKIKKTLRAACGVLFAALALTVCGSSPPANSVGTVNLSGSATTQLGLFGSPTAILTGAPEDATISLEDDTPSENPGDFTGSVNFGNLSDGDNTGMAVATFGLRARGNSKCHISSIVSAYNANNIKYAGTVLDSSASAEDLTMFTVKALPGGAGMDGDSSGLVVDPYWQGGTNTVGNMNSGVIGWLSGEKQRVVGFSKRPSHTGNLTSPENWVQTDVSISVPIGFAWEPVDGAADADISVSLQFELFPGEI